jgi:hypothetical protein
VYIKCGTKQRTSQEKSPTPRDHKKNEKSSFIDGKRGKKLAEKLEDFWFESGAIWKI